MRAFMALWLALAAHAVPAMAQEATASASVTSFSIKVVDPTPSDGLAAGWTLQSAYTHYVHSNPETPGESFSTFFETMLGDRSFGYADAASEARARTTSDALFADASIHAFDTRTGATTFTTVDLLLTPHSAIAFSGLQTASLHCVAACVEGFAHAQAALWVFATGTDWPPLFSDNSSVGFQTTSAATQQNANGSRPFLLTYSNDGDSPVRIQLHTKVDAVVGNIPPVPEPATAISLLLGIASVAGVLRRRRAGRCASG